MGLVLTCIGMFLMGGAFGSWLTYEILKGQSLATKKELLLLSTCIDYMETQILKDKEGGSK